MIIIFFLLNLTFADTIETCEYYKAKSQELKCESTNYLTSFGYKYCRAFFNAQSRLSPEGVEAFTKIRPCLIEALEEQKNLTCNNVKKIAKKTHVICYLEGGFCNLNDLDKNVIYTAALREGISFFLISLGGTITEACRIHI